MSKKWSRAPRVIGIPTAGALAFVLTACGQDQRAYCVDRYDRVVDQRRCEDDGGRGYFIYYGSGYGSNVQPGTRLTGGNRIAYNDANARANLGLPKTGGIGGSKGGGVSISSGSGGSGGSKGGGIGGGFGHSSFGG